MHTWEATEFNTKKEFTRLSKGIEASMKFQRTMPVSISMRLRPILIRSLDVVQVTLKEWDTALDFTNAVNNMVLFSKCWAECSNAQPIHFEEVQVYNCLFVEDFNLPVVPVGNLLFDKSRKNAF